MQAPKLSGRLSMAAKLVRKGGVVADIGTDHAFLPVYLVGLGICPKALACDLRKGPLENARQTVLQWDLQDKITLRLSDGLNALQPGEATDFVFAGMGGTLIAQLMARQAWVKDEGLRFIFQPQSHSEDLRRYLWANGFEIAGEQACEEDGRVYIAFSAAYTGEISSKLPHKLYFGDYLEMDTPAAKRFTQRKFAWMQTRANALKEAGQDTAELQELESALSSMQSTEK